MSKTIIVDGVEYIEKTQAKAEEKVVGLAIKNRFTGSIIFQSTKTTYKEAIIEKGDTNLRDADLRDADLRDSNLYGADLRDADLRDSNLYGADLCSANLCGADLRGADFRDAELNSAKFYGRGGTKIIKKANLVGFLGALGFLLEE